METFKLLFVYFVKILPIILIYLDYTMEKKQKKANNTLAKELSSMQKTLSIIAYLLIIIALLLPTKNQMYYIALSFGILVTCYYFWYSDKRVYIANNLIYLRGKEYPFKQITAVSYENKKLEFSTKETTVTMKYPFLLDEFIEKRFINQVSKRIMHQQEKDKKRKK